MTFKKILLGAIACTMAFSVQAQAGQHNNSHNSKHLREKGAYVAVRGGLDMMRYKGNKDTWVASGALGAYYDDFRAELEYGYRGEIKKSLDSAEHKVRAQTYLVNLYYDMPLTTHLKPYISAGAGIARVRKAVEGDGKNSKNKFAWTAGAGMAFDLSHSWSFDVGYRYLDMGSSVSANEFYGGLRMSF